MRIAAIQRFMQGRLPSPSLQNFVRCRDGATAVEFALVATPFIALLVAILQTIMVFFAQRVLDEITEEASRYIMTGQAQTGGVTQSQFANYLCTSGNTSTLVGALFTCGNFMINVQNYPACSGIATAAPVLTYDVSGNVTNNWSYNTGSPGDCVAVMVMYQWPVVLGPLNFNLGTQSNGSRLLVSVAVFANEPY